MAIAIHADSAAPTTVPASATAEPVHFFADEMPSFPGGDQAFQQFIRTKINYPTAALNKGVSGKVHVRFIVDADGRIRDAEVVKGMGHGLDEEALRLVRIMPWWTPGRLNGQPVRVSYTMPIVFRASK